VLGKKLVFRLLARREAERIGLTVDETEMQDAVDDFRHGSVFTAAETPQWAAEEGPDQ
jgi:hypothetical protein